MVNEKKKKAVCKTARRAHSQKQNLNFMKKKFSLVLKVEFLSYKPAFSGVFSNKLDVTSCYCVYLDVGTLAVGL